MGENEYDSDQENSLSRFSAPGWIWYYCCWLIISPIQKMDLLKWGSYSFGQMWNNLKLDLWCYLLLYCSQSLMVMDQYSYCLEFSYSAGCFAFSYGREIIQLSCGSRHLSTISLKNFHFFKIIEFIMGFCFKKISIATILNMWKFLNEIIDHNTYPP